MAAKRSGSTQPPTDPPDMSPTNSPHTLPTGSPAELNAAHIAPTMSPFEIPTGTPSASPVVQPTGSPASPSCVGRWKLPNAAADLATHTPARSVAHPLALNAGPVRGA
eukprot:gene57882-biopygen93582